MSQGQRDPHYFDQLTKTNVAPPPAPADTITAAIMRQAEEIETLWHVVCDLESLLIPVLRYADSAKATGNVAAPVPNSVRERMCDHSSQIRDIRYRITAIMERIEL